MGKASTITHKLLGKVSQPYINAREIELSIQFDPEDPHSIPTVALSNTDWAFKEAQIINRHIRNFGIHSGIPYQQIVSNGDSTVVLIDGFLQPSGSETLFTCESVKNIPVILKGKNDWLNDAAKLIMFNTLLDRGIIRTSQYIQVPYVINTIPDYTEAAIATISAFVVINKIIDISKEISKVLGGLLSVIGAIGALIKAIIVIAWVIVVLGLIVLFLMDIANHIIQPVKYHASMRWRDLLVAGCGALGLGFSSSIFDEKIYADAVIMPAKLRSFEDVNNANSLGFTIPSTDDNGYYKKSFFELLLLTKDHFNAKIVITNDNVLVIERVDKSTSNAEYTLPNLPLTENGTNASEIFGNYIVEYKEDLSDNNTIDNYEGTLTQAITSTTSGADPKTVTIGGSKTVDFQLSRASRKKGLNNVEKRLDLLFKTHSKQVNKVADITNKLTQASNRIMGSVTKVIKKLKVVGIKIKFTPKPIPKLVHISPDSISERVGMMMLSNDFFQVDKVMSLDVASTPFNTKLKINNDVIFHSKTTYDKFHVVQSHAPTTEFPFGNQYRRYSLPNFNMCLEDVIKVINNNLIFTSDGRTAKIESLNWRPFDGIATDVKIRILHVSDRFLVTKTITENGL